MDANSTPASPAQSPQERRTKRRVKVSQPVRVRLSEPGFVGFDEVQATINISRTGLYFPTDLSNYRKGMRVRVTFPYSEMPNALNVEYEGNVVRVDRLAHGRSGVAIQITPREEPKKKSGL